MQEPTVLILTALADGPKHGYALIREADALSDGRVRLGVGTLYAALDRLSREGLVEPSGEEVVDGRLRRFYALTGDGREALQSEIERMQQLARRVTARLRHSPLASRLA
jgi:DNA-binding PadR family transcriptional regulator